MNAYYLLDTLLGAMDLNTMTETDLLNKPCQYSKITKQTTEYFIFLHITWNKEETWSQDMKMPALKTLKSRFTRE